MRCPACGTQVSKNAQTCAMCGTAFLESMAMVGSGRLAVVPENGAVSGRLQAPQPAPESNLDPCAACGSPLEREAGFCSDCGAPTHTGEFVSPLPPEPEPEFVLEPEPLPVSERFEQYRAYEPDVILYEEEVVIPQAADREPIFMHEESIDPELIRTGPVPIVRHPEPADSWSGWVPATAAGFAVFALLVAVLVHLLGPSSLPNHTPAEVDLKIQMRAIEWLLAGILIAMLGLLAKKR